MATLNVKHSAAGGGDGSSGSPYTLQEAFDNVAAGDTILVWATGTYSVSAQIDVDTTVGTAVNPIKVRGANSSGTVDGTRPVLQASASISWILALNPTYSRHYVFEHLDLDGNSNATNILGSTTFDSSAISNPSRFFDCLIHGASDSGIKVRSSDWLHFYGCEIYGNGSTTDHHGIEGFFSRPGNVVNCSIHDNSGDGVRYESVGAINISGCLIYDNGGDGIRSTGTTTTTHRNAIAGNTIYGNTGNGIGIEDGIDASWGIYNNSLVSNGGYGLDTNGHEVGAAFIDYNHTHDNSFGACDTTLPGDNNVTGAPSFASTTDGSEDFTPGSSSPLLAAGLDAGSA